MSTNNHKKICANCKKLEIASTDSETQSIDSKCSSWLEQCTIESDNGDTDDADCTSVTTTTTNSNYSFISHDDELPSCSKKISCSAGIGTEMDVIERTFNQSNHYEHINITNGERINMGNITNIYGPVHITHNVAVANEQHTTNNIFLKGAANTVKARKLHIIDRTSWLAQYPEEEPEYLKSPAKLVIISHTATEEAFNQAKNTLLVRLIQTFHISSRGWNDIGYNFLIGCDGLIYQGRGWNVVGAHARGYNDNSIGISFVGTFMNKLPPQIAIYQAKALIEHGIEIGAIDKDYLLLGHCQCSPTESPGKRLFEEIQTWDHWKNITEEDMT